MVNKTFKYLPVDASRCLLSLHSNVNVLIGKLSSYDCSKHRTSEKLASCSMTWTSLVTISFCFSLEGKLLSYLTLCFLLVFQTNPSLVLTFI